MMERVHNMVDSFLYEKKHPNKLPKIKFLEQRIIEACVKLASSRAFIYHPSSPLCQVIHQRNCGKIMNSILILCRIAYLIRF